MYSRSSRHPALTVIDYWLTHQAKQGDLPGFQVSIREKQNLIFNKAYSYADIERNEPYSTKHLGRIASQSKIFTATLCLLLESNGLLKLTDLLIRHLPQLKRHPDPRFKKITLLHLLSNRSGLFRDSYSFNYWGGEASFLSRDDLFKEVMATKLIYTPGKYTKYSNLGFALLGCVLEEVSGQSYSKLVTEYIFNKLNGETIFAENVHLEKLARGYLKRPFKGRRFKPTQRQPTNSLEAATGLFSNTESLSRFLYELLFDGKIIGKKSKKILLTTQWPVKNLKSDRYGLGLIFSKINGYDYIGHAGGFPGFASQTWVDAKTKYIFSFITNVAAPKTFNLICAMNEIFKILGTTFSSNELNSIVVSAPIADNFLSTIYVVGKTRAIAFPLSGWVPTEGVMTFKKRADYFYSDEIPGYLAVGEPLRFSIKSKKIVAVQFGGFRGYPLKK